MKIKIFLLLCTISYACRTQGATITLLDALHQKKVELYATGNSAEANPQGGSHTGKCLKLKIKNNTGTPLNIKIESAYQFQNQHKAAQDLMVTENMLVSIAGNQTKSVNLNALCTEKTNSSPSEQDTFLLIKRNDARFTDLSAIFEKYKCFLNTAQQAIWCFTDNNPINYIYDTDGDTTVENVLVAYVSTTKGVPMPVRKRYVETPRIIYYPVEVDSSISVYIDRVTTLGIYITDSSHHPIITLFADETESRTGTAKYSFFYRGQQPKGRYYVEMKKNGAWVRLKELQAGN
jgi:hypothetical protein